jgi:hypothetical protein
MIKSSGGRVNVCLELREKANEVPTFISRIITGDESWIYGYDPETKQQSSLWRRFKTVSDIPRESQAVLDSIQDNDFRGFSKRGKNDGIAVYVPMETILEDMAAKIE